MKNIYAGIVTFNPDLKLLCENIKQVITQTHKIIIVDNASKNIKLIQKEITKFNHIILITNDKNRGIAAALNQIMLLAQQEGISWVLLLDQDSIIPDQYINKMRKYTQNPKIAIICPRIYDRNRNTIDKLSNLNTPNHNFQIKYVDKCITSGSLTSMKAWNAVNGFDELLFIDGVDFDFCSRLIAKNYRILQLKNLILSHCIGCGKTIQILGKTIEIQNHSPMRKYYIARNRVYCEYKAYNTIGIKSFLSILKLFFITILFEKDKMQKCKSILYGTIDGIKLTRRKSNELY